MQVNHVFATEAPGYPEGPITWFEAAFQIISERRNARFQIGDAGTEDVSFKTSLRDFDY